MWFAFRSTLQEVWLSVHRPSGPTTVAWLGRAGSRQLVRWLVSTSNQILRTIGSMYHELSVTKKTFMHLYLTVDSYEVWSVSSTFSFSRHTSYSSTHLALRNNKPALSQMVSSLDETRQALAIYSKKQNGVCSDSLNVTTWTKFSGCSSYFSLFWRNSTALGQSRNRT